jgi:hypothetical protein
MPPMPIEPFGNVRTGFQEVRLLRPGMAIEPLIGELAWHDYELFRLIRRTVRVATDDDHPMDAAFGDYIVTEEWERLPRCSCGWLPDCERHALLDGSERAAVLAIEDAPIRCGLEEEPLTAGVAAEIVLALRVAGFRIQ